VKIYAVRLDPAVTARGLAPEGWPTCDMHGVLHAQERCDNDARWAITREGDDVFPGGRFMGFACDEHRGVWGAEPLGGEV
jgi:hypothetical protein